LQIDGVMAADAKPDVEQISIDDSALFAAMKLQSLLESHGITVDRPARTIHASANAITGFLATLHQPLDCELANGDCGSPDCMTFPPPGSVIAAHISAPMIQDIVYTDKTSQNLHAEVLMHDLAARGPCTDASNVGGARRVRAFLLNAGIDGDDFIFYDGSGLSAKDLVTPRATAQLLSFATTQPWFAQWKSALPVGGVDGTLSSRFKEAPLKGHVFAKTGTLGESRALSGYVDCASGRQVIFSIMVDNHSPVSSGDREVMDKIVAAIAAED
jgi:D-alanyl-D-alanine carboxypeptidase/D-alanyl-D-alanine-endopeptidase (penicillin-binding protein 4)